MRAARMRTRCSLVIFVTLASWCPASASAPCARNPQIPFASDSLQADLNIADSGINVLADQLDAQTWECIFSQATIILQIESESASGPCAIGVYNTNSSSDTPPLYEILPSAATPGWLAECHFSQGRLNVQLIDDSGVFENIVTYAGIDMGHIGFYLQSGSRVYYSQDARNAGHPQALTYESHYTHFISTPAWWECLSDSSYDQDTSTFNAVVLLAYRPPTDVASTLTPQPCLATPVRSSTWGRLKSIYR
jgi:hypothetical protein